jgi:hypothetical protein
VERFSKERGITSSIPSVAFLDREYRTLLHIDVLYDADEVPRLPYMGASKRRLLAQSRSILCALSKFSADVKSGWLNKRAKMIVAVN